MKEIVQRIVTNTLRRIRRQPERLPSALMEGKPERLPGESQYEYIERTLLKPLREKEMLGGGPRDPWKDGNMI